MGFLIQEDILLITWNALMENKLMFHGPILQLMVYQLLSGIGETSLLED